MNEPLTAEIVWGTLNGILDPEFGLSIVELGLVYDVKLDRSDISVAMTLTTPSCPAGDLIFDGVRAALTALPGAGQVRVDLVWEPAWTPDMLTAEAREFLGWSK